MENNASLSIEDTNLIADALAGHITERLVSFDAHMDNAYVRHKANSILAGHETGTLLEKFARQVQALLAKKVGKNLAAVARLSQDALIAPDGLRRWLNDAHKATLAAFLSVAADYRSGKVGRLDLFLTQVALAGLAQARGLLGIPADAYDRPQPRKVRMFEPEDFPDENVRAAIVDATFNASGRAIAFLRGLVATTEHDGVGQITLVLATLDSGDDFMHKRLAELSGKIIAADQKSVFLSGITKGRLWAWLLATPLDQQGALRDLLN